MDNQAKNTQTRQSQERKAMTDAGKELVCSCIGGKELRSYLLGCEWKQPEFCCDIIAGSLKTLNEKRTMLEQLRNESPESWTETIDSYLEQLESALEMLANIERDRGVLLISAVCYSEEEHRSDTFDGPFPTTSWEVAQKLMKHYLEDWSDDDWSESYWTIELYTSTDLHEHPTAQPSMTFAADKDGELIFLNDRREHRTRRPSVENVWWNKCRRFCANEGPFQTPWVPGDIIKIDGRPFDHGPRFAIVLEDDYGSMIHGQDWCAGPSRDYGVSEGALNTKTFMDGSLDDFTPSALYTAERYTGNLPDDCAFMIELSEKLHNDPSYGKQWSEGSVGHDCLQPYRKTAGPKAQAIRPDILEFIDSPDIRNHLKDIDYEFTTPIAAFVISQSRTATLQEKLDGWQKVIDNMPNCAMSHDNDSVNIPDFHAFLRDVIKRERRKLADFRKPDAGHLYFFRDRSKRQYSNDYLYGPYSSCQTCFDAIWKELDGDDPVSIEMARRPIDPNEENEFEDTVMLNARGEVTRCQYRFYPEDETSDPAFAFERMWFDIPTPFRAGDIVCDSQNPDKPVLLLYLQTWNEQHIKHELPPSTYRDRITKYCDNSLRRHRHDGDTSDMLAYACLAGNSSTYPIYIGEPVHFYLDLKYYREPLKPAARILRGVKAYLDGNLGLDSLMALSHLYTMQSQAKKKAWEFAQEDGWLMNRYPELFNIEAEASAKEA